MKVGPGSTPDVGDIVHGRYKIERRIGGGSRGIIFAVIDLLTLESKALKWSKKRSPLSTEAMTEEVNSLLSLHHGGILTLHDHGWLDDGRGFLVTELVTGANLAQIIQKKRLELYPSLMVARRIADTLEALHALGRLHRDVKPLNVLVPCRGTEYRYSEAKLIDFGASRMMNVLGPGGEPRLAIGETDGTLDYMAPEQLAGRFQTPATDVFGLGATLFALLAGHCPQADADATEVEPPWNNMLRPYVGDRVVRRLTELIELPSDLSIPNNVRDLVQHCVRLDPIERPQTAAAVGALLDELIDRHL